MTFALTGLILIFGLPIIVSAQTTAPSVGCSALDGFSGQGTSFDFGSNAFLQGEVLIFALPNEDAVLAVSENGAPVSGTVNTDTVVVYEISADGDYAFSVVLTGGTDTTTLETYCLDNGEGDPDVIIGTGGTICHIPPGNPSNAHTINVGGGAVAAHLRHGDTVGECPDGVDTRIDDTEAGLAIFVHEDDQQVQIYGNCDGNNCTLIAVIDVTLFIPQVGFEIEFDDNPDDGYNAIVYYLHPLTDGDNEYEGENESSNIYVFQLNIYLNDTLQSDNVLILINADGEVIAWTTHAIWNDLAGFLAAFDIDLPED